MTPEEAARLLRAGGVVGIPTDTVYGLAAAPHRPEAVERLYELKGRPSDKPIALLVPSLEAAALLVEFGEPATHLARRHWPGALTLIVPTVVPLSPWIGDRGLTAGVRMPDSELTLSILRLSGPLAVTSANRSGETPAVTHGEAVATFGETVDGYVEGICPGGSSSTVVDVTGVVPRVLRPGPVQID